jgi:hypothetical protein
MGIADKEVCFLCEEPIYPFEHRERDRHGRPYHPACLDEIVKVFDIVLDPSGLLPWEMPGNEDD